MIDVKANQALLDIAQNAGLDVYCFGGINGRDNGFVVISHRASMESFNRYQELMETAREIAEEAALSTLEFESIGPNDQSFCLDAETETRLKVEIEYLLAIGAIKHCPIEGVYERINRP